MPNASRLCRETPSGMPSPDGDATRTARYALAEPALCAYASRLLSGDPPGAYTPPHKIGEFIC